MGTIGEGTVEMYESQSSSRQVLDVSYNIGIVGHSLIYTVYEYGVVNCS